MSHALQNLKPHMMPHSNLSAHSLQRLLCRTHNFWTLAGACLSALAVQQPRQQPTPASLWPATLQVRPALQSSLAGPLLLYVVRC